MYSIAFYLHKGGTGKSSLSILTAQLLSLVGKKVVLIDCDTQGNATTNLLKTIDYLKDAREEGIKIKELIPFEVSDCLKGKCYIQEALIEARKNLFILPTRPASYSQLINYAETELSNDTLVFESLNKELKKEGFEFIIYDMAPNQGTLQIRIIKSVNEVVLVTLPEAFSIEGLNGAVKFINQVSEKNLKPLDKPSVKVNKILVNRTNESFSHNKKSLEAIKNLKAKSYVIGQAVEIPAKQTFYKTILDDLEYEGIKEHKIIKAIIPFIKDLEKEATNL